VTPPRTSGFGALSWLWWPVAFLVWAVAADELAAEWVARAVWRGLERAIGGESHPAASRERRP
jgi:hypothetical protein